MLVGPRIFAALHHTHVSRALGSKCFPVTHLLRPSTVGGWRDGQPCREVHWTEAGSPNSTTAATRIEPVATIEKSYSARSLKQEEGGFLG